MDINLGLGTNCEEQLTCDLVSDVDWSKAEDAVRSYMVLPSVKGN